MGQEGSELLRGTLDLLVLRTLEAGPRHGYGIARWIEQATGDAVRVEEGSLYPALYRMERKRWILAEWGMSELGRRARFYRLTVAGREHLERETRVWARFNEAVRGVLVGDGGAKA
jgi:transcriptional regulator